MKKLLVIPAVLLFFIAFAQKGGAPDNVKSAFTKAFPGATNVKYEKEEGNYEVSFKMSGKEMSAVYDAKGGLIETEEDIKANQLPASVIPYFNAHYKGVTIKETAKIVDSKGVVTYEIGTKEKDIMFDAAGKFLKEVKKEDKD